MILFKRTQLVLFDICSVDVYEGIFKKSWLILQTIRYNLRYELCSIINLSSLEQTTNILWFYGSKCQGTATDIE